MREQLEMFTASLMQYMVQIRKKSVYFATKAFFETLEEVFLGLSALKAPIVGPYTTTHHPSCINNKEMAPTSGPKQ